jgi:hypothetical protein
VTDEHWLSDIDTAAWPDGALAAVELLGELADSDLPLEVQLAVPAGERWVDVAWLSGRCGGFWRLNDTTLAWAFGDGYALLDFEAFQASPPRGDSESESVIATLVFDGLRAVIRQADS